jgi:hypothetical protein
VAKEETVLQGIIKEINGNCKMLWNGNEFGKTRVMVILREPSQY